jgi:hypothetical protein
MILLKLLKIISLMKINLNNDEAFDIVNDPDIKKLLNAQLKLFKNLDI